MESVVVRCAPAEVKLGDKVIADEEPEKETPKAKSLKPTQFTCES
jgi:hypothetical protein